MWCNNVKEFRENLLYTNASEVYDWLKKERYEYLVFDGMAYKNLGEIYGVNETNGQLSKRIEEISTLGRFQPVHQTNGVIIFKIL